MFIMTVVFTVLVIQMSFACYHFCMSSVLYHPELLAPFPKWKKHWGKARGVPDGYDIPQWLFPNDYYLYWAYTSIQEKFENTQRCN